MRSRKGTWQDRSQKIKAFFCPLCKVERRVSFQPSPTPAHFVQIALTSAVITLALWPWLEWKGIVVFLPLWTVFEIAYRLRSRSLLHCSQCGFDPYLCMSDLDRAKREVRAHWKQKFAEKGLPDPYGEIPPPPPETLDKSVETEALT